MISFRSSTEGGNCKGKGAEAFYLHTFHRVEIIIKNDDVVPSHPVRILITVWLLKVIHSPLQVHTVGGRITRTLPLEVTFPSNKDPLRGSPEGKL